MISSELKVAVKECLQRAFGPRLISAVFYGSRVLDTQQRASDLDLLVVLKGPVRLWDDTHAAVRALYDIQLQLGYPVHVIPVDLDVYEEQDYALYRHVKKYGVAA